MIKNRKLLLVISSFFTMATSQAEEWKNCDVFESITSPREAAIELGKIKKRIAFFKKPGFASITFFFEEQPVLSAELIPTGRGLYADGKPFLSYANKANTVIVQEFEGGDLLLARSRASTDYTLYARCR